MKGRTLLWIGVEKQQPLPIGFIHFPEVLLMELIFNVLGKGNSGYD